MNAAASEPRLLTETVQFPTADGRIQRATQASRKDASFRTIECVIMGNPVQWNRIMRFY